MLKDDRQKVDLLFTELGLYNKRHGGIELSREAVKSRPKLRVLYTSGQDITDGMKALFVENSHFIPKPYTSEALVRTVRA